MWKPYTWKAPIPNIKFLNLKIERPWSFPQFDISSKIYETWQMSIFVELGISNCDFQKPVKK